MSGNAEEPLVKPEDDGLWNNCEEAFDRLNTEKRKIFFDDIRIARDGGIHDIKQAEPGESGLWANSRYISMVVLIAFIVYNLYYILSTDIASLKDRFIDEGNDTDNDYLITKWILDKIFGRETRKIGPFAIIATVELVFLGGILVKCIVQSVFACMYHGYHRWINIARFCWDDLQLLSCFSAMRLLGLIVPQRLTYDIFYALFYAEGNTYMMLGWILVSRPVCFIFGMDCFLVKYRQATEFVLQDNISFHRFVGAVIFLNQIVGVVNLSYQLKGRLYRFVFGGEDGVMQPEDENKKNVWEAFVCEMVCQKFPWYRSVPILMTWSDSDFQFMVLREKDGSGKCSKFRRKMKKAIKGQQKD